jgi:hypothetical protein
MARKWYRRPGEADRRLLIEGYRDQERYDYLASHAPLWVDDPDRIGLRDQETALLLYGYGASFRAPIDHAIAYEDTIALVLENGDTVTIEGNAYDLYARDYGLIPRLALEDIVIDRRYH